TYRHLVSTKQHLLLTCTTVDFLEPVVKCHNMAEGYAQVDTAVNLQSFSSRVEKIYFVISIGELIAGVIIFYISLTYKFYPLDYAGYAYSSRDLNLFFILVRFTNLVRTRIYRSTKPWNAT